MPLDHTFSTALHPTDSIRDTGPVPTASGCFARWHVLIAKYGQINLCEQSLIADGWPCFWPRHLDQKHSRIGPLFGPYGFAKWSSKSDEWPRIYSLRGVFTILSRDRCPLTIPVGVVEDLVNRTSPRGVVDDPGELSDVARIPPGARVSVLHGPWQGFQGITTLNRRSRVTVLLSLFGRVVPVDLRPDHVQAA